MNKNTGSRHYFERPIDITLHLLNLVVTIKVESEEEEMALRAAALETERLFENYAKALSLEDDILKEHYLKFRKLFAYVCLDLGRKYHLTKTDLAEANAFEDKVAALNQELKEAILLSLK